MSLVCPSLCILSSKYLQTEIWPANLFYITKLCQSLLPYPTEYKFRLRRIWKGRQNNCRGIILFLLLRAIYQGWESNPPPKLKIHLILFCCEHMAHSACIFVKPLVFFIYLIQGWGTSLHLKVGSPGWIKRLMHVFPTEFHISNTIIFWNLQRKMDQFLLVAFRSGGSEKTAYILIKKEM